MYSSEYLVGDVTTIVTHLRLRNVIIYCYVFFCEYLVCVDGTIIIHTNVIFGKVFFRTVMYLCGYLVCDVTTIHTTVIFRKVFFWISSRLMVTYIDEHEPQQQQYQLTYHCLY